MTLKLALGNVSRCARDYGVYFVTLALAVAMFYAFNSLGEQSVLVDGFDRASESMLAMMTTFMQLFSAAVVVVLAFLVVYANRFLLKRRKREFGLYLMLGMSPLQVSKILLAEVAVVGVAALAVGILLGIAASQGMAFATAALMGATMSNYHFIVSTAALVMTLVCFAAIFVLSAIVDVIYISRRKLADLVSTHERSEKTPMRNPIASLLVFIASIVILAAAYWQLDVNGLVMMDEHFWAATALMVVGTTLFFWSIMGFVNALLARSKSLRFKNLHIFTLRQLSSKMNTAFASMTVICIMLFFAATTLAGGFGMVKAFVGDIETATQYDATITENVLFTSYVKVKAAANGQLDYAAVKRELRMSDGHGEQLRAEYDGDMAACLAASSSEYNSLVKASAQLDYFPIGNTRASLFKSAGLDPDDYAVMISGSYKYLMVSSIEQLNAVRALTGKKPLELGEDEFLIVNSTSATEKIAKALCDGRATIKAAGRKLACQPAIDNTELFTSAMASTSVNFFVPQSVIDKLKAAGAIPLQSYLNVMYKTSDRASGDKQLYGIIEKACPVAKDETFITTDTGDHTYRMGTFPLSQVTTAAEMLQQAMGIRMIITYLALYIGFVLMLTTAAVLAIQQLSEVTDSLPRYRALSTLGASEKQIARSLRHQTLIYFAAPLAVAACHTACALFVLNGTLMAELGVDMATSVTASALIICAIYAVYFAIAYKASKSMVKSVLV